MFVTIGLIGSYLGIIGGIGFFLLQLGLGGFMPLILLYSLASLVSLLGFYKLREEIDIGVVMVITGSIGMVVTAPILVLPYLLTWVGGSISILRYVKKQPISQSPRNIGLYFIFFMLFLIALGYISYIIKAR